MYVEEDPYIWLENIDDQRVREWVLERSNRAKQALRDYSEKLLSEILELYKIPVVLDAQNTDRGVYVLIRKYDSYSIARLKNGELEEIVNSQELGKYMIIRWFIAKREGDRIAFSFSQGSDEGVTRIIDPDTGEVIDEFHGVVNSFTWLNPDEYYYVRFYRREKTPDGMDPPAERVFLRSGGKDELVFGKGLSSHYLIGIMSDTSNKRALITVSYGWDKTAVYVGDLYDPSTWRKIYGDFKFRAYPIDYVNGEYYILSYDGKGMGRIIAISESGDVREIVDEDPGYPLRLVDMTGNRILCSYLVNASSQIRIYDLTGRLVKEYMFSPPGTVTRISCRNETCVVRYESFYIPYRLYEYNIHSDSLRTVLSASEEKIKEFKVEEFWVKSYDGTPIHVFRVYSKSSDKAILYGYGGFNIPITPRFIPHIIPFIERGGEYYVANIRGGGEFGEEWHRAGMRENKENVFRDFIAVLKHLYDKGYRVIAMGSSNGGLLVAVTLTRVPELLAGAVIGYPVLDMLRFHKLYIGKVWITEYGDPDNPHDREYLAKYSPYHNLAPGKKYPPVMIYTGLYDGRVHPGHALKFAAKLEELGVEYYLRVETVSGHSGAHPLIKARELADIMAFVFKVLGIKP
ncbi:MAG: prolyl oligopeptidase family serine peptidase [Thermoprotei archaeon]